MFLASRWDEMYFLGLIFLGLFFAVISLFLLQTRALVIDRGKARFEVRQLRFFRRSQQEYSLNEVQSVCIETIRRESTSRQRWVYTIRQIVIRIAYKDPVIFVGHANSEEAPQLGNALARDLGVGGLGCFATS